MLLRLTLPELISIRLYRASRTLNLVKPLSIWLTLVFSLKATLLEPNECLLEVPETGH